jgi:ligand-binding sensor domain-containing protein
MLKWRGILFLFLVFSTPLWAQNPYFKKIGPEMDAPSSTIYDLFSSREGHLYLGVELGLAQFNGTSFRIFPIIGNRSRSMNAIQQHIDGSIWCMNFTNQIFYLHNDTLRPNEQINSVIDGDGMLKDFKVHPHGIYFLTENTLFIQRNNGEIEAVFRKDTSVKENTFVEVIVNPNTGETSVTDLYHIFTFSENHEVSKQRKIAHGQNTVKYIRDNLVFSPKNKMSKLTIGQTRPSIDKCLLNTYINHIIVIDDELWLCTNIGLIPWKSEENRFDSVYFKNTRITNIVKDFQGGYWVSSVDRGLFYIPNLNLLQVKPSEYSIYRICNGPENSIFIGAGDGVIFHLSAEKKVIKELKTNFMSEIEYLYFDRSTNRLISSHGVFEINNNYNYTPIRLGKNLTHDDKGNFMINTYNQALIFNQDLVRPPKLGENDEVFELVPYSHLNIPTRRIYYNRSISGYFEPLSQSYFLGAYDALYKIDVNGKSKNILYNGENIVVLNFLKNRNGRVILSTLRHGILMLENDQIKPLFQTENILQGQVCIKTLAFSSYLFILTDFGLQMVNTLTEKVTNVSDKLSLKNTNIFDFEIVAGELLLATDVGLLYFPLPSETAPVFPKINSLSLYKPKEGSSTDQNRFSFRENNLRLKVDAVHFQNYGQFEYYYRLKGFEDTWHTQSSKNNQFSYLSLPPGKYTFELKVKTNEAFSPVYSKSFSIQPPFWTLPWFYALVFVFAVFLSYLFFRRILLRQSRAQLIKQQLLESQLVSIRSQMNPHFLFNIVNSVQGLIYANKKNEASDLLGKMSGLMRSVLDISGKSKVSIQTELEILQTYVELEAARFEDDFEYLIETNIPIEEQDVLIPSMIIQPFVENAIKHGLMHQYGVKKLRIDVSKTDFQTIQIIVEDNGIGREASQKINANRINHQSFASKAIDTRISLINKANNEDVISLDIEDLINTKTQEALGTKIIIEIRVNNEILD